MSHKTKKLLHTLIKNNHKVIIATGRPFQGTYKYYKILKSKNLLLCCDNGSSIYIPDGKGFKVKSFDIDKDLFINLYKDIKPYIASAVSSSLNYIAIFNKSIAPPWLIHKGKNIKIVEGNLDEMIVQNPLTVSIFIKKEYLDLFLEVINSKQYQSLFYENWGLDDFNNYSFEIHQKNINKGSALQFIRNYYHIKPENTISAGDNLNDIEMLKQSSISIAMKNADLKVKEIATNVTAFDNDHDGLYHELKKICEQIKI